ncbi:unnamed protein product [Periconia digitata]|uniref:Uncharacterized protein n=1 Tax=Periconia digitata TaxID=1303443 RepID=A0A9W4XQ33_9PLEO|nr:unnamed protein product [Periconia digitata]
MNKKVENPSFLLEKEGMAGMEAQSQQTRPLGKFDIIPLRLARREPLGRRHIRQHHTRGSQPRRRLLLLPRGRPAEREDADTSKHAERRREGGEPRRFRRRRVRGRRRGVRGVRDIVGLRVIVNDGFLARLEEDVIAFSVDEPVDDELFPFGPAAAGAGEEVGRRGIDREREEVRGFREIRDEASVEEEVDEDEDVHKENEEKDHEPGFGPVVDAARGVLLRCDGRVEVLGLVLAEFGDGEVPVHYEGRVEGAHEERAARHYGEGFRGAGEVRGEADVAFGVVAEDELGEEAGVAGAGIHDA